MYGAGMPRRLRTTPDSTAPARSEPDAANLNEVVAYNFRRARELRGLTQDEAAVALEPFLGVRLPQAAVSAIERSYRGDRRREFDAQEILAFACAFDLPLTWFFLPPLEDERRLQGTSDYVRELYLLLLGRDDQLEDLYTRFRELGIAEPGEDDEVLARVYGAPTGVTMNDYRTRRKELLLALLDQQADAVDASAEQLGAFFDHLRQVGVRGLVAEQLRDADFLQPGRQPATPGKPARKKL